MIKGSEAPRAIFPSRFDRDGTGRTRVRDAAMEHAVFFPNGPGLAVTSLRGNRV